MNQFMSYVIYGYSYKSLKMIFVQYIRMNLRNQKYKN